MTSFQERIFNDSGWRYPLILDSVDGAAEHLVTYLGGGSGRWYSGAFFNHLTKESHPNRITATDLIAIQLLSVTYHPTIYLSLLGVPEVPLSEAPEGLPREFDVDVYPHDMKRITELLEAIPTDAAITDTDALELLNQYGNVLWRDLRRKGLGEVGVSKLLASKRPGLFPIYDSVVRDVLVAHSSIRYYEKMRDVMIGTGGLIATRLEEIRESAGAIIEKNPSPRNPLAAELLQELPPLRILDIVLWMEGQRS